MKNIVYIIITATLFALSSCETAKTNSSSKTVQKNNDQILAELDSIGKSYTPKIGTYGGMLNLGIGSDPDGFCPLTSTTQYTFDVVGYIFEGLVTLDPVTLEYKPSLAKSWTVSDNGLHWEFKLRDDVKFSDGVPFTAFDVDFTFNDIILNKKIRSQYRDFFVMKDKEVRVVATDSFTVTFDLPYPYAPFLNAVGVEIMPKHKYYKAAKDGSLETILSNGTDPKNVIGTGPFVLDKVELGQRISLKRNSYYWKKNVKGQSLPYLDGIRLYVLKEPNREMLLFKKGELDQISVIGEHYPILKPLEKEGNFKLYNVGPTWGRGFFTFNQNDQINPKSKKPYLNIVKQGWFRDKKFRKACAYAINYPALINIVYNGLAYPPSTIMGSHKGFFNNDSAMTYNFDPQKAKSLLKEAGYKDTDGDGFLEDSLGNVVEFTLTTSAGVKIIQKTYEMVRKDLENIGLKVHLNFIEFNNLVDKLNNTYNWDVVALGLGGGYEPHFSKSVETYSSFRYYINPKRPTASTPWEERIAEIFEQGVMEMDRNKRKVLYDEWQAIVMDQCVRVYMPLKKSIYGVSTRLENIHLTKYAAYFGTLLHNIDEIYLVSETKK